MKSRFLVIAASCSVLFLSSCSPPDDSAENALRQSVQSDSGGHIQVVSFTKTDGQKFDAGGAQGYRLAYKADLQFDHSGTWSTGLAVPGVRLSFTFSLGSPGNGGLAGMLSAVGGDRAVGQGEHVSITGVMTGTKSENGGNFVPTESRIAQ